MSCLKSQKPISTEEIVTAMQSPAESRGTAPPGPILNGPALLRLVNGDVALLRRLVEVFREGNPKALADIRTAIGRGDAEELRRAAHALAGTISNFSTQAAFRAARELE